MKSKQSDLYQEVTTKIIACLEKGVPPWVCPWDRTGEFTIPANFTTGKPYQGINVVLLWLSQLHGHFKSAYWMTFKQAQCLGGRVQKLATGTRLVFYKPIEKHTGDYDADGNEIIKTYPMLRSFTVFNVDQIDGLTRDDVSPAPCSASLPMSEAEAQAADVLQSCEVSIHHGGTRAYYRPATDSITLPDHYRFASSMDYFATALHEIIHATGHISRCSRQPYASQDPNGAYAYEELVAEIGASFSMAWLGLRGEVIDHASYIDGWLQVLKDDKKAIFKAAAEAQKAHEWLMVKVGETSFDPLSQAA